MSEQLIVKDQRLDHWYKVDNALILQYGAIIGPYGIAVYNVLALHANHETHEAYPSYQTIAELVGCSRRKVIQTLELLESHNIVRGEGRMKNDGSPNSNVWVLVDKSLWGSGNKSNRLLHEVVNDMHYPSESDALPVVNDMHQGSAGYAPKQESMNKTNNNNTTTTTCNDEFSSCVSVLSQRGLFLDSFTNQLAQECFDDIDPQGDETKLDWFTYACRESAGQKPSWKFIEAIIRGVSDSGSLSAHKANRASPKSRGKAKGVVYGPKTVQDLVKQTAENGNYQGLF